MAKDLMIGRAPVRERSPWAPVLLGIVTIGIYGLVWYYKINREMRDVGTDRSDEELAGTNPVLSILAVTVGALIIVPPIVSFFKTVGRIRRVEELSGVPQPLEWGLVVVLYVLGIFLAIPALFLPFVMQDHLNRAWNAVAVPSAPVPGPIANPDLGVA